MNQTFERIEKHHYCRQYQTAGGEWSTLYYVRFKDWKGKHRTFLVGSDLKTARDELRVYEARNIRREDFDADKETKSGLTFSEWAAIYFRDKIDPEKRAGGIDARNVRSKPSSRFRNDAALRHYPQQSNGNTARSVVKIRSSGAERSFREKGSPSLRLTANLHFYFPNEPCRR